jgi:hypothetical protein
MNANNEDFNICVISDKHINLVEVRATSLKNIMDLATSTVIRYVENMLQIRRRKGLVVFKRYLI